jgi:hypothetical protein
MAVPSGVRISQIVSSVNSYSLLLAEDGQIYGVGENGFSSLGDGTATDRYTPVKVNMNGELAGKNCTALYTLYYVSIAICNDKLYTWGHSMFISDKTVRIYTPTLIEKANMSIVSVHTFESVRILGSDGFIYVCGAVCSRLNLFTEIDRMFSSQLGMMLLNKEGRLYFAGAMLVPAVATSMIQYIDTSSSLVGLFDPLPFNHSEIALATIWFLQDSINPTVIVVLHNGTALQSGPYQWEILFTDVNPTLTTHNIIVFNNGTLIAYWRDYGIRKILFTQNNDMKKISNIARTVLGVSAVVLKCSPAYTGLSCDIPICFGKSRDDANACSGNGECISPDKCICKIPYGENNCSNLTTGFTVTIIVLSTIAGMLTITALFIGTIFAGRRFYIVLQSVANQRKAEIEMKSLLHESLIKADSLSEKVDRDWVIPLSEVTFKEKVSEGAYGIVFSGSYKNADV